MEQQETEQPATAFRFNYLDFEPAGLIFEGTYITPMSSSLASNTHYTEHSKSFESGMPNPFRAIADGMEIEGMPIILNEDDMSGNISNQWNLHYTVLVSFAGLPCERLEQMMNINFFSTSPHASALELIKAVLDQIRWASKPQQYFILGL